MTSKIISQLEFEAQAVNLKVIRNNLRHIFSEFEIEKKIADDLVIAINEACMNIIQHGYSKEEFPDSDDTHYKNEKILLIIEKDNEKWRFELIDFASPVDIESLKAKDLNDIRPGGLGLNFINEIMDSVKHGHIENSLENNGPTGNRLILTKSLK